LYKKKCQAELFSFLLDNGLFEIDDEWMEMHQIYIAEAKAKVHTPLSNRTEHCQTTLIRDKDSFDRAKDKRP